MTVSAQNSYISYTGNGSTAAYSWPYKLFAATDLKVYTVVIATGVETLQTSGGSGTYDYNINSDLDTVTLNNNLPATHKLFLTRRDSGKYSSISDAKSLIKSRITFRILDCETPSVFP